MGQFAQIAERIGAGQLLLFGAVELTAPLLILTAIVGAASIRFDHRAVSVAFRLLACAAALPVLLAFLWSPTLGLLLLGGGLHLWIAHDTYIVLLTSPYVPWAGLAVIVVAVIRFAVKRRR